MSYQISSQIVIDNSRNVIGTAVTASSNCATNVGDTAGRTSTPTAGSIRYNSETGYAEYYNGTEWVSLGIATTPATANGTRALFGGGLTPALSNTIDYINIANTGNATDFGDLSVSRYELASHSSSTRGIFAGGLSPANENTIDYVTIASAGNATDFGDLTSTTYYLAGCSNSTRGLFGGGWGAGGYTNVIQYTTIATTGNATLFGYLTSVRVSPASCSSSTRGVFAGGAQSFGGGNWRGQINNIDYVTIATTGNSLDFGDLTSPRSEFSGCSSPTRGVFAGGNYWITPSMRYSYILEYITFESKGNTTNFGDTPLASTFIRHGATSNSLRGVFAGATPTTSAIDYITIESTGNTTSFGSLSVSRTYIAACSDGHGGL